MKFGGLQDYTNIDISTNRSYKPPYKSVMIPFFATMKS